jgi:hypothetical protein
MYKNLFNIIKNMGLKYLIFKIYDTLETKFGIKKIKFPTKTQQKNQISLKDWKRNLPPFFFYGKDIFGLERKKTKALKDNFEHFLKGKLLFFNHTRLFIGTDYNWLTNPMTSYQYDIGTHWSKIADLSEKNGDIKYVWEKARFSYLYDLIRYDYHFEEDQSKLVLSEIQSFIEKNPINQGPNYICSQEISLRILNWTFALYYYKDSKNLTENLFNSIMNAIYWQLQHVYRNINFSRIAVRNNHAITETLMLYLSYQLFPFIPETKKWSKKGKKYFEEEIDYQIYKDGTFLQYSMNYHRVVVQLLTWAIRLSGLNKDRFKDTLYKKAKKSLEFLDACTDPISGNLPNYGANDGALFFKLTEDDYRNYRSQLDDLRILIDKTAYHKSESAYWYGFSNINLSKPTKKDIYRFKEGGYYIIQDADVMTFIRCGAYKDRPGQSDNLHLDIWVKGINVLRDSGSYKYNTSKELINYFNGVEGHNTLSVAKSDQMLKGTRFIWYNWIKEAKAYLNKKENYYEFKGSIKAFKDIGKDITHSRTVKKQLSSNQWEITDKVVNKGKKIIRQYWHIHPDYVNEIQIVAKDKNGNQLVPVIEEKWYSSYYGVKEKSKRLTFVTSGDLFYTTITIKL